MVSGIDFYS